MDLPTALLRDVLQLSDSVGVDDDDLRARLMGLVTDLKAAVSSFRGLHITVAINGHPVELALFLPPQDGESITTSLRLPFAALGNDFEPASRVVFYAATPGALVDLAADLSYALSTPTTRGRQAPAIDGWDGDGWDGDGHHVPDPSGTSWALALDVDLPPSTLTSGMNGLSELSTINQAVGVLIEQGEHPDRVHATLAERASRDGMETHLYAARLVRTISDGVRRPPESG